jgi:hypothetical protein
MKMDRLTACGLLAAIPALLSALHGTSDAPHFTPKAGVSIKRTLEMKGVRELRSMVIKAGDKEQNIEDVEVGNYFTSKNVILDEYLEVAEKRVIELGRTFESLAKSNTEKRKAQSKKEEAREVPETCALEGRTVVFTWNAEKKAYDRKFKSGDHDEQALAKLNVDMDYAELLPPPDTAEGVKWHVELVDVKTSLLRPAGYLPFKTERKPPAMELRLRDAAWEGTTGHLELAWSTRPEADGLKLAAIVFEGTLAVEASVDREDEKNAPDNLGTSSSEKIHGELLWDLARGGPHSIEWTSTGTARVRIKGKQPTQDGQEIEMEQIMSFDQEYTFKGTFEVK